MLELIGIIVTIYLIKRFCGTLGIVLGFLLKIIAYCLPVNISICVAMISPWWLILCIPLSVGYYFLINKIFKKLKRKKYVVG